MESKLRKHLKLLAFFGIPIPILAAIVVYLQGILPAVLQSNGYQYFAPQVVAVNAEAAVSLAALFFYGVIYAIVAVLSLVLNHAFGNFKSGGPNEAY